VTGGNSVRAVSIPVWFVLDGEELYLLPAYRWDTQWYKNVLKNFVGSDQGGGRRGRPQFKVVPSLTPHRRRPSAEKFRAKYGDGG
jgi:hypothetical protein